jgi:hypothetical protein
MDTFVEKKSAATLTPLDRCDRCSARAAVKTAMLSGGSLLWCGHHYASNEAALFASGAIVVIDDRSE